jgi:hypothetical protein
LRYARALYPQSRGPCSVFVNSRHFSRLRLVDFFCLETRHNYKKKNFIIISIIVIFFLII